MMPGVLQSVGHPGHCPAHRELAMDGDTSRTGFAEFCKAWLDRERLSCPRAHEDAEQAAELLGGSAVPARAQAGVTGRD